MNNATEARRLLRSHRYGALSTQSKKFDGYPFGSITPYLVDHDGSLLILISGLAEHTKNIGYDPRVSLITHNQHDPQIQTQGRVTVLGNAEAEADRTAAGLHYLRHFPESEHLLMMQDFVFYRIHPVAIRYIGGFGRIHWVNMAHYGCTDAHAFAQQEVTHLALMSETQLASIRRLIEKNHGVSHQAATVAGIDCDGLSINDGGHGWRLDFDTTCRTPHEIPAAITALLST
jgi:hypothetical protein